MKALVGALLLWGSLTSTAQAQLTFSSLQELLQYADKNSLVAKQSELQQAISRKDEAIHNSALLPKLNLFGTADYYPIIVSQVLPEAIFGGSPDRLRKIQFGLPWIFSTGAELTLPVINFEQWEQVKRFRLQSEKTVWTTKTNMESLHIQLTQWYYQMLLSRELINLNKENLDVAGELIRVMEERKKNGVLNPADYNRSKNLQLDVQTGTVEYEKAYQQAILALKQLLNLSETVSLQIRDSLALKNWLSAPQQIAITERPAWKEAESGLAVAMQELKEKQKAGLPRISLSSRYTYQWQMKPANDQYIHFPFSNVGLRLDFPIFQGNYYRTNQQRSELQVQLAQTTQQQTANELTQQQTEWWNNYQAAVKKHDLLKQKLEAVTDNLRIARLNMNEGVMEFDEFNEIFREYSRAKIEDLQNTNDGIVYWYLLTQKW
jgi:outer membrane protein TolC